MLRAGDRPLPHRVSARSAGRCRRSGRGRRRSRRSPRPSPCPAPAGSESTGTRPRSSSGRFSSLRIGCGATPAVQTTVRVGSTSPLERRALSAVDLLQRRLHADVDAAAAQLPQRVFAELAVDLRQHPVGRLDQDPAHPVQAGARVAVHRVGGEVLQLGQRLEAGVAAADEDVGEQFFAPRRVLGRVGFLQRLDHVVAEVDRVGEALEPDRVLGQAGHRQHPRDRAEREQQLVVGQLSRFRRTWPAASPSSPRGRGRRSSPSRR